MFYRLLSSSGTKSRPSGQKLYFNISVFGGRTDILSSAFKMFSQEASPQLTYAETIASGLSQGQE